MPSRCWMANGKRAATTPSAPVSECRPDSTASVIAAPDCRPNIDGEPTLMRNISRSHTRSFAVIRHSLKSRLSSAAYCPHRIHSAGDHVHADTSRYRLQLPPAKSQIRDVVMRDEMKPDQLGVVPGAVAADSEVLAN